ncbi:MAG: hypothetical protein JWO31_1783 [Phycisphaerales bacterium]|nr:hypothetical protein [Phycisphaerales bacterium]
MTTVPYGSPTTPPAYRRGVNVRLLVFLVVVSAPFLWIIGSAIHHAATGGVTDHGGLKEVDLKALGNFPFDDSEGKVEDVPKRYRELDGQKVMLKGFMYSTENAGSRGNKFQFVYDVQKCCFGGPPQVQERVFGFAKNGIDLFDQYTFAEVRGTLHVRPVKDAATGKIVSLYDMDVESSKPLTD